MSTVVTTAPIELTPDRDELLAVFDMKYRRESELGWGPKTRLRFGYFNPDDYYEAVVAKLVKPGSWWADVGCGREIFPSNAPLARLLADRAAFLFGIDPDPNIHDNPYLADRFEGLVEECQTRHRFDVITLRMVAEHVTDPDRAVEKLARLTKPGGIVVVYTPNRWAPVSIIASLVPNRLHHRFKRIVWDAEERDTFPTAFKLNTRGDLARHFGAHGMREVYFAYLDDCRTFSGFRALSVLELCTQRLLRWFGLRYPENCLLGVYRKDSGA
jgi:SAM-dependent methyltransferase